MTRPTSITIIDLKCFFDIEEDRLEKLHKRAAERGDNASTDYYHAQLAELKNLEAMISGYVTNDGYIPTTQRTP